MESAIEKARKKFQEIVRDKNLGDNLVEVRVGTLTASEAIGNPSRQDFPLLEGREVMIEARFKDSSGQAFTDRPNEFEGTLNDVLSLPLNSNDNRAVLDATLNAVMTHLELIKDTRHCRNEEPEECAVEMAKHILTTFGKVKIGQIGYQPAILENLVLTFGADNIFCTDLNPKNIGSPKHGIAIWDGRTDTDKLIMQSDIILATSSTIVNDTFDSIREKTDKYNKKLILFGVTGAGISTLLGIDRLCFQPG
jgi:uncharacterized protein (DUF4213/DUF364 family)